MDWQTFIKNAEPEEPRIIVTSIETGDNQAIDRTIRDYANTKLTDVDLVELASIFERKRYREDQIRRLDGSVAPETAQDIDRCDSVAGKS